MAAIHDRWGLTPVINASGTMTTLGASRVGPEVRADVDAILCEFVRVDELQERASGVVARLTGAEAGFVTSSSSAAITVAAAAAITGDDLAAIEALPACNDRERRIAIPMGHMVSYGAPVAQAVALSGAEVVPLGSAALCETYHLQAALDKGLAAALYVVSHHTVREGELPLDVYIETCRRHGTPVIVDMAAEYDLRGPVALGAAAVIYSGHKFLAGTTSGIVAGTKAMMRAMFLQQRGIARVTKVGKEGVIGAMAALAAWEKRDHAAEDARRDAIVRQWLTALDKLPGVSVTPHSDWTGNPTTRVELHLSPNEAGLHAWELAARLMAERPAIAVRDDLAEHQLLYLDPATVTAEEGEVVARAIWTVCDAARASGDGCARSWSDEKRARGRIELPWLD